MPQDRVFKRLVRRRMAETGERYTVARAALSPATIVSSQHVARWIEQLANPELVVAAYEALRTLPEGRLRSAALRGLAHPTWRVRRSCCRLLDDLALTPVSIAALTRCLSDAHPRVRRAAVHSLTCKHCKPAGCAIDVRSLAERMASDPSRLVRSAIPLFEYEYESWVPDFLRRYAEDDPSATLRAAARDHLAQLEAKRRSNEDRLRLPDELRAKMERHRGRWVAIAAGRIVAVSDPGRPGAIRHARRTWPDTALYWVAPR